jgi:hypothetical protein
MDQPCQRITCRTGHEQREPWAFRHLVGYGLLARANEASRLRVLASGVSDIVLTSAVHLTRCTRRLFGSAIQGFPDLIQHPLGCALLRLSLLQIGP